MGVSFRVFAWVVLNLSVSRIETLIFFCECKEALKIMAIKDVENLMSGQMIILFQKMLDNGLIT